MRMLFELLNLLMKKKGAQKTQSIIMTQLIQIPINL